MQSSLRKSLFHFAAQQRNDRVFAPCTKILMSRKVLFLLAQGKSTEHMGNAIIITDSPLKCKRPKKCSKNLAYHKKFEALAALFLVCPIKRTLFQAFSTFLKKVEKNSKKGLHFAFLFAIIIKHSAAGRKQLNKGAFPSGQWGQTVNLLLNASVVRIHQLPPQKPHRTWFYEVFCFCTTFCPHFQWLLIIQISP